MNQNSPIRTRKYIDFVPRGTTHRPAARPTTKVTISKTVISQSVLPQHMATPAKKVPSISHPINTTGKVQFGSTENHQSPKTAPDANKYTLGGKSPFINKVDVEKRPLSNSTPAKNIYSKSSLEPKKSTNKKENAETKVVKSPVKKSKIPMALLVIVTIILGAAVGASLYLLLFQN